MYDPKPLDMTDALMQVYEGNCGGYSKGGEKKLDAVGKEDKDIDNDGDHDKSDKYLLNRRKVRGAAIKTRSEEVTAVEEGKASMGADVTDALPWNRNTKYTTQGKLRNPGENVHGKQTGKGLNRTTATMGAKGRPLANPGPMRDSSNAELGGSRSHPGAPGGSKGFGWNKLKKEEVEEFVDSLDEQQLEYVLEFIGGRKGDGYIGHPNLDIKNPLAKTQTKGPVGNKTGSGMVHRVGGALGDRKMKMDSMLKGLSKGGPVKKESVHVDMVAKTLDEADSLAAMAARREKRLARQRKQMGTSATGQDFGHDYGISSDERKKRQKAEFDAFVGRGKKTKKEDFELWVHELLEEGYDLSDYTWDEMFDIYEGERAGIGGNRGLAQGSWRTSARGGETSAIQKKRDTERDKANAAGARGPEMTHAAKFNNMKRSMPINMRNSYEPEGEDLKEEVIHELSQLSEEQLNELLGGIAGGLMNMGKKGGFMKGATTGIGGLAGQAMGKKPTIQGLLGFSKGGEKRKCKKEECDLSDEEYALYESMFDLLQTGLFTESEIDHMIDEGYKEIDKKKENEMYRKAGNLARKSLSSDDPDEKEKARKKSAKIVSAIASQKENERFKKMGDEKARDNYEG